MRYVLAFSYKLGVLWKAQCVFFDLSDIEDPTSYFLNNRVTTTNKGTCSYRTSQGIVQGKCLHAAKCLLSKGVIKGSCGFGSSCCIYQGGCNSETREKTSFCSYKIHLLPNTCQVRLDFQKFLFNPPTEQQSTTTPRQYSYTCTGDSMTVTPNHYFIPTLCGNNNNQHVYVHLNRTIDSEVLLQINFGDRSTSTTNKVPNPEWNIKVTQLECKATFDVFHPDKKNVDDDLRALAPLGALQYFTDNSGTFRTFGLEEDPTTSTTQPSFTHTSNLRYAIAFKRYPNICGVKFHPTYLQMGTCTSTSTEYIFAPEATPITTSPKYCQMNSDISMSPPGPLYIHFSSTVVASTTSPTVPYGFVLNYNLVPCTYQVN
ncbi:hypothetical protein WA026_017574 [Henosepilachna vigintioctopunctata]|uniref:CUB domain-containing protein n=1 Tax=Henosepilachna vigintioctopunctata TaxID=420089 RepID=A0AAW1UU22_9CUCU